MTTTTTTEQTGADVKVEEQPQSTDLPPVQEQQALATREQTDSFGLMPRNLETAWRLAKMLAQSVMVPKDYQGKPEDVIVAMQLGAEVGLPPMQSLQSIAVINGRPSIWGDGFLGLIKSSPKFAGHDEYYTVLVEQKVRVVDEDTGEVEEKTEWIDQRVDRVTQEDLKHDDTAAVCKFWRRGKAEPYVVAFTIGMARKAGLLGKSGPWSTYPDRMLRMRARSWCGRDAFPDVLRGLVAAEEARDIDPTANEDTALPPREPQRRSERASQAVIDVEPQPSATDSQAAAPAEATPPAAQAPPPASPTGPAKSSAPAPPAAKGKTEKASGDQVVTKVANNVVITETAYVTPRDQDPFWEVKGLIKEEEDSQKLPHGIVFITRDKTVFDLAASCEGSEQKFTASYHLAKRRDGSQGKVLDSLKAQD